jgi:asparagine synthase (glutamine-hydrolysing)
MCGIAGFAGEGDQADLFAMCERLVHRGPDGDGYFVDDVNRVFLGHRRLAILDLVGGHQPMFNEDRTIAVIFNGEIYNHRELRNQLMKAGHRFATHHSDTEVLVHGYEEWSGEGLLERINGMYAFAIYDRNLGEIFLGRDRFGKKPLFYSIGRRGLVFASELSALAVHAAISTQLDPSAVRKFFAYGYIPAPLTIYRGIRKLEGGGFLRYRVQTGEAQYGRGWSYLVEPEESSASERSLAEQLRELLSAAVQRRLESDVPLGIFLSGGIDSSAVAAMASKQLAPLDVATFCIGFDDVSYDESGFAAQVARHIESRHYCEVLTWDKAERELIEIASRMDEPLGDPSLVATHLLSKFARRHVKVALSGDGGDELFAGYDPFKALLPAQIYSAIVPRAIHPAILALVQRLPLSNRNMGFDFRIKRALQGLSFESKFWNPAWLAPFGLKQINELFDKPINAEELYSEAVEIWDRSHADNLVDRTIEFYTNLYLRNGILTKADRASMTHSLEVRSPFLDRDVVEFARRLPNRFKFRNGTTKYLLKKTLKGLLPNTILHRRKKGFGIPIAGWLRKSSPPSNLDPQFGLDSSWLSARWQEHLEKRADHRLGLWCWVALDLWSGKRAGPEINLPADRSNELSHVTVYASHS